MRKLIEFKGITLPVLSVTLRSLQVEELSAAVKVLLGDDAFFDGDAAVLELTQLEDQQEPNWAEIIELFKTHGLHVIGIRGACQEFHESAANAGLPCIPIIEPISRQFVDSEVFPVPTIEISTDTLSPVEIPPSPTLVIDRPLRSGQQIYARNCDLVVLAAVNAGAEVIADGSIHIYAPLRGRALAGASGATDARIFTTRFEAELVSIAGLYRTFEAGVPDDLAGKPVQVQFSGTDGEINSQLSIKPLQIN